MRIVYAIASRMGIVCNRTTGMRVDYDYSSEVGTMYDQTSIITKIRYIEK